MGIFPDFFSRPGLPFYAARMNASARRDLLLVICVSVPVAALCVHFNLSEAIATWTRPLERFQADEFPGVLLVMSLCLFWFASRRYVEANRELVLRKEAEKRLAEALAENQRLALKYVDMQEMERKALARDLHDELGQYINAIKLDAVGLRSLAAEDAGSRALAATMIANIDRIYEVVRGLVHELRPVGLDDLGLAAALEHCVAEWRARLPSAGVDLRLAGELELLDEMQSLVVYRLVQEALTNIARHAAATRVRIAVNRDVAVRRVDVVISDDGRGTDLSTPRAGLGLVGMRERVNALGGTLTLDSQRGNGFMIAAAWPLSK
jgi:two-component system sensor histidine kinase UhpB